MTRVYHARPHHGVHRPTALEQPSAALKKKKPYKIVLEAVTQEKKKLHSIISYASNAPTGFGFIPAGHPEFTEWCKEQCRQRNLDVHVVSAKPRNNTHTDPEKLAHHVHRVGHHFPLEIVNLACAKFGYTYDDTHGLRKAKTNDRAGWIARQVENYSSRQALHGRPTTETETKNHIQGAVRELFPKIPETDLSAIVNHAFKEGTDRVGNAKELPLARRVQLAVTAHIRHMYTNYDNILKTDGWKEARQQVESVSLAKIKEWRDETGEHSNELEETFREVIVLDDDEESSDDGSLTPDGREPSMEIVSSRATARELQPERYDHYPRMDSHDMRRVPRRTIVVQPLLPLPPSPARAGPSYNEAGSRPVHTRVQSLQPVHSLRSPIRTEQFQSAHSRPIDPRTKSTVSQPSSRNSPSLMRDSDGRLYQLQRVEEPRGPPRVQYDHPIHSAPYGSVHGGYVQPPPRNDQLDNDPRSRPPAPLSKHASEQELVLPSVERETGDLASPRRVADGQHAFPVSSSHASRQGRSPLAKRKRLPSNPHSTADYTEKSTKHSKPVNHENEALRQHEYTYAGTPPQTRMYQPMDVHSRPRGPPLQQEIDLTSSPRRLDLNDNRGHYVPAHNYPPAGPSSHSYVTVPSRHSSPRDGRGIYYDVPIGEASHTYVLEHDRPYERRAPSARDYFPVREKRPHLYVEDERARYMRNELRY